MGKTLQSLLVPGGILLLGAAILAHSGWLTVTPPALSFLYFSAVSGGMLLAWRFHSSRTFLALLVLFLADQAVTMSGLDRAAPSLASVSPALQAIALLVPLNFLLISFMQERGFTLASIAPAVILLFAQSVFVAVLTRAVASPVATHSHHAPAIVSLPGTALAAFAISGVVLLAHALYTRKPADSALLWSLTALFLSLRFLPSARISGMYSVAAATILATAIIENSYLLAYHDELTTLPSRRAFNDAMARLQDPFSIAVVDIDHFKSFNDTYGHDTGDQVLRLVASNLARVTGGGQAYRCGGEEFAIVFPGKTIAETAVHLEQLRARIEQLQFRTRGNDRRLVPRGPDRRNQRTPTRGRKGYAIRRLANQPNPAFLSVTVSIGLANCTEARPLPEMVLEDADKALYRAKENGRNRLESAIPRPRRTRSRAAGIA
ncbi:MAG TPA: GGDEF domain-containing protein [Candidatus Solibacter sp.]|nr:GGDEF domain-containing protein [Candidatus Solibacter sp.]